MHCKFPSHAHSNISKQFGGVLTKVSKKNRNPSALPHNAITSFSAETSQ